MDELKEDIKMEILIIVAVLLVMGYVFRMEIKKYWRYIVVVVPFLLLVCRYFLKKNRKGDIKVDIERVREEIEGVKIESAVEMKIAREKNEEMMKRLEEIKKIEDKRERRRRLAELIR